MKRILGVVAALSLCSSAAFANGTIEGKVKFTGKAPEKKLLDRRADPICEKTPMADESVLVNGNGTLQNVIVRITKGVTKKYDPPAKPAVVDQNGCMYRPRVSAVVAGQKLQIRNSDNTLHNIHTYLGREPVFNRAMPNDKVPPLEQTIQGKSEADVIRLQCDVHPWMKGFISVTPHPFVAVTGAKGTYDIADVPPGRYTLEALHETFGSKTVEIEVKDGEPTKVDFTFDGK